MTARCCPYIYIRLSVLFILCIFCMIMSNDNFFLLPFDWVWKISLVCHQHDDDDDERKTMTEWYKEDNITLLFGWLLLKMLPFFSVDATISIYRTFIRLYGFSMVSSSLFSECVYVLTSIPFMSGSSNIHVHVHDVVNVFKGGLQCGFVCKIIEKKVFHFSSWIITMMTVFMTLIKVFSFLLI